eukprot:36661-Chlamydomonas_euryale.AAC.2
MRSNQRRALPSPLTFPSPPPPLPSGRLPSSSNAPVTYEERPAQRAAVRRWYPVRIHQHHCVPRRRGGRQQVPPRAAERQARAHQHLAADRRAPPKLPRVRRREAAHAAARAHRCRCVARRGAPRRREQAPVPEVQVVHELVEMRVERARALARDPHVAVAPAAVGPLVRRPDRTQARPCAACAAPHSVWEHKHAVLVGRQVGAERARCVRRRVGPPKCVDGLASARRPCG